MDIKTLKLELMQHLLQTESEELLKRIQDIFSHQEGIDITDIDKKELDSRKQRYLNEEGASYSWDEVKANARKSKK